MKFLLVLLMFLACAGCLDANDMLCGREHLMFREAEVCCLCCSKKVVDHWQYGGFQAVPAAEAKRFVDRMFRDRDFFRENVEESYNPVGVARHLASGESKAYYAETDKKEIYLYVYLTGKIYHVDLSTYRYYPGVYFIYDKLSGCIDSVTCFDVDQGDMTTIWRE